MLELLSLLKAAAQVPDLVSDIASLIESCHAQARDPTAEEISALNQRLDAHLQQFNQDASGTPPAD